LVGSNALPELKPNPLTTAAGRKRCGKASHRSPPRRRPPPPSRALHELQVHPIELAMQNDGLQIPLCDLETVAARYTDLYDFAPVGYVTLDRTGAITQTNLAAASLPGHERARLMGKSFAAFVAEADQRGFAECLHQLFAGGSKQSCKVALDASGPRVRAIQITATRSVDARSASS